jgi:hypothetical protein
MQATFDDQPIFEIDREIAQSHVASDRLGLADPRICDFP